MATRPQDRIDQLLSTDGIGTLANANAITAAEYTFKPLLSKAGAQSGKCYLWRLLILIEDSPNVTLTQYGSGVLTNGAILSVKSANDQIVHRFNPIAFARINDWGTICGPDLPETAQSIVIVRFSLFKGSEPLDLYGNEGEYLSLNFPDAPTGLTTQYAQVQGMYS